MYHVAHSRLLDALRGGRVPEHDSGDSYLSSAAISKSWGSCQTISGNAALHRSPSQL